MNKETLDSLKETLALYSAIDIGRFGIYYDLPISIHFIFFELDRDM